MSYTYATIEDAVLALRHAEADVAADYGDDMVEAGFSDLVESIAYDCAPAVASELYRRELGWDPRR